MDEKSFLEKERKRCEDNYPVQRKKEFLLTWLPFLLLKSDRFRFFTDQIFLFFSSLFLSGSSPFAKRVAFFSFRFLFGNLVCFNNFFREKHWLRNLSFWEELQIKKQTF